MKIGWKAAVHDSRVASFRYRVEVPVAALQERGHNVELFDRERVGLYDLVVFSKNYGAAEQEIARAAKAAGKRVVLDICDNHLFNPFDLPRYRQAAKDLRKMIALADQVICSTPALATVLKTEVPQQRMPLVVGDAAELIDLPERSGDISVPRLLWFGSHGSPNAPSGMTDLLSIREHLQRAYSERPFELIVASNNRDKFDAIAAQLGVPSRYVEWSQQIFPQLLADSDAVLIPLSRNPFVDCKTHNRVTTALAAGIPVVADSIESYREFAQFAFLDNWQEGLRAVLCDSQSARERARPARQYIEENWSIENLAPQWEAALALAGAAQVAAKVEPQPQATPHRPRYCQGALDRPRSNIISGWARMLKESSGPLEVELRSAGVVVATALANLPRADLLEFGFSYPDCGFEFEVPVEWRDGALREFEVVASGNWVIGKRRTRFVIDTAPATKSIQPARAKAEPERPAKLHVVAAVEELRSEMAAALRLPAEVVHSVAAPAANITRISRGIETLRTSDGVQLQQMLADELEELSEALEVVKRVAARIVLSAGNKPAENAAEARKLTVVPGRESPRIARDGA